MEDPDPWSFASSHDLCPVASLGGGPHILRLLCRALHPTSSPPVAADLPKKYHCKVGAGTELCVQSEHMECVVRSCSTALQPVDYSPPDSFVHGIL